MHFLKDIKTVTRQRSSVFSEWNIDAGANPYTPLQSRRPTAFNGSNFTDSRRPSGFTEFPALQPTTLQPTTLQPTTFTESPILLPPSLVMTQLTRGMNFTRGTNSADTRLIYNSNSINLFLSTLICL